MSSGSAAAMRMGRPHAAGARASLSGTVVLAALLASTVAGAVSDGSGRVAAGAAGTGDGPGGRGARGSALVDPRHFSGGGGSGSSSSQAHARSWAHGALKPLASWWCALNASSIQGVAVREWGRASAVDIMCIPDAACEGLSMAALGAMRPQACAGWGGCFSYAQPAAFGGMTTGCLQYLNPTAMFFVAAEQVARIPPGAFADIPSSTVQLLPMKACSGISPLQLAALPAPSCEGIEPGCLRYFPTATLRAFPPTCLGHLRPEIFDDMPIPAFAALPHAALAAAAPSQIRFFGGVCAAVSGGSFDVLAGIAGACAAFSTQCLAALPVEVFAERMDAACASQLALATCRGLPAERIAALRPSVFRSLTAAQLSSLDPARGCRGIVPAQLTPSVCVSLTNACLAAIPPPNPCTGVPARARPPGLPHNVSTVLFPLPPSVALLPAPVHGPSLTTVAFCVFVALVTVTFFMKASAAGGVSSVAAVYHELRVVEVPPSPARGPQEPGTAGERVPLLDGSVGARSYKSVADV